jgi:hypothetical protein
MVNLSKLSTNEVQSLVNYIVHNPNFRLIMYN